MKTHLLRVYGEPSAVSDCKDSINKELGRWQTLQGQHGEGELSLCDCMEVAGVRTRPEVGSFIGSLRISCHWELVV